MGLLRFLVKVLFGGASRPRQVERPQQEEKLEPLRWPAPTRVVTPVARASDERPTAPSFRPPEVVGPCYVVDGDTIRIRDMVIRVSGIDAPELDQPYGVKAKWAMHRLCKGHDIRAELAETDVHGRTVARCFLPDGRDLGAEMVKLGHAVDWPKYSGGRYRHLEVPGVRKRLWRCDARQKGRFPTT